MQMNQIAFTLFDASVALAGLSQCTMDSDASSLSEKKLQPVQHVEQICELALHALIAC